MIPRYQRVLFWVLLCASIFMAVALIRLRERAQDKLLAAAGNAPASEPAAVAGETATLLEANDLEGSVDPVERKLNLPEEPNARARVLLQALLASYAAPKSAHPILANGGVDEVFFMPLPATEQAHNPGQLAVVNLSASFAANHPSGIEPETLTLLSIIGTLHQNFPMVEQVRFLVDGQPRDTLAGHADLTRTYIAADTLSPQTGSRP